MRIMQDKKTLVQTVTLLDKLYNLVRSSDIRSDKFMRVLNLLAKLCIDIYPEFSKNMKFQQVFSHIGGLLSSLENKDVSHDKGFSNRIVKDTLKLLDSIASFERDMLGSLEIHYYFVDCKAKDILMDQQTHITEAHENDPAGMGKLFCQMKTDSEISVLVHSGDLPEASIESADFHFPLNEVIALLNSIISEFRQLEYNSHDKLFLEAKLDSLKHRTDIQLLLAGSSYTMCGLKEAQMPVPARNVAVDAQDIYYTVKTIRTALKYDPNIKYCILSLAYYLWGNDISRSTSDYNINRLFKVNYPIFNDIHHYAGSYIPGAFAFDRYIFPVTDTLFSLSQVIEKYTTAYENSFAESDYFPAGRKCCLAMEREEKENLEFARDRANGHNKFYKFTETVEENRKIFAQFLDEMNQRDIKILLHVPPVTNYYRKYIDPRMITDYYEIVDSLQNYKFGFIDLFASDQFVTSDFADYDHLNDKGAEKLGRLLTRELNCG